MTLRELDSLMEEEPERYWEYYYFVVEKIKAEHKAIEKAKERASGGSGESDTFKFKDMPEDHISEVEEME